MENINSMFEQIFSIQNIIIYLVIMNIIGFLIMLIDKKKAKYGKWRIRENTLFIVAALGGGIGTIAGMYTFRHKTKKMKFTIGMPTILIAEIVLIVYVIIKYRVLIFG